MRLDLHVHTTCSDGTQSPEDVVDLAVAGGLDVISITDHDNAEGVGPASKAARGRLRVIPGVEMSSRWRGSSIHILGYFIDPASRPLTDHYRNLHERRHTRMVKILQGLATQGIRLPRDRVADQRASGSVPYTRPHLARALVRAGFARNVSDAFERLIGAHCPAYVEVASPSPEDVIHTIMGAGGVAVWAHPPIRHLDALLPTMIRAGLRGLEVFRLWPRAVQEVVADRARTTGLFATGGSDWHGRDEDPALGSFFVTEREVGSFLDAGGG